MNWGRRWLVDSNPEKSQPVSFDHSNNTVAIDVKIVSSALEKKSSFKILVLSFSFKLDWSSEAAPYLYKSTIQLCMKYYCDVWAGSSTC